MLLISDDKIKKIRAFTVPGFDEVPLVTVLRFFVKEIKQEKMITKASSVSFFFLLSLFPGIIFLFTLIPYLPVKDLHTQLLLTIKDVINNKEAYQLIRTTVNEIVAIPHQGLMSFGFLFALYSAMSGVKALITSFNKIRPDTFVTRNIFMTNWVALKLTFIIVFLLIVSLVLIIAQDTVFNWVFQFLGVHNNLVKHLINLIRYLIIIGLFFTAISFIYYYGPAVKRKFRFVSAGSTFATLLSIATSVGFSYFVNNFGSYNKVYGSIGSMIVIMLWVYFNSFILLLGFELNASIAISKNKLELKALPVA
jgi:membrane protein